MCELLQVAVARIEIGENRKQNKIGVYFCLLLSLILKKRINFESMSI